MAACHGESRWKLMHDIMMQVGKQITPKEIENMNEQLIIDKIEMQLKGCLPYLPLPQSKKRVL